MSLSKTIGVISGINECVNLFQWARSAISSLQSRWSGTHEQKLQDEVLHLQRDLRCLSQTLPAMYDLIDRAEWMSHKDRVAKLLPEHKDAVYDADDLLDEFRWYELKLAVEGNNASQSPFMDFFSSVIQGGFNKVNDIQKRLNNLSSQLEKMKLLEVTRQFDKSVRPETSSFPNETKIFGRDKELKQVMGLLGVPANSSRAHSKRKRANCVVSASASTSESNQVICTLDNNDSRVSGVPILPMVGIGGVGKTTLAQHICNHPQVNSHFDLIIWICVSDDFDVKRLTKEAIQSASGKEAKIDNLDSLQRDLANNLKNKRFLLILDDMWDDSLKEDMQCWKRFCSPLTSGLQGSMMLVTTRSREVADGVRTMEPIPLEGLKDDIFWDFFKLCVFGPDCSNNDPELESIGRSIVPKLKGSPLAAKTLGRLLRMKLHPTHWNNILKSELWELKQKEIDILPALRLSYIYLPYHLKRCFSFCAVYPKDHKFEEGSLAQIWVAEGFVEPQGDIPIQNIGCQYFEDLVNRSFFQKVSGSYVIHDLLHDMAQLVSKHDCFVLKDTSDFQKVPQNVRHLSILSGTKVDCSNLLSLSKHTKLRTLLCSESLASVILDRWCSELGRMRVIVFASTKELPDSIGNLKHLRYLEISRACPFESLPSAFCCLYNLQIIYASRCKLQSLPKGFSKLLNLQVFELSGFRYHPKGELLLDADNEEGRPGIRLIKNMNQICGGLIIYNLGAISMYHAIEAELKKKNLDRLELKWSRSMSSERNHNEVLEVLQPPTSLKSLRLSYYPGGSLPSWFQPRNLPSLTSLEVWNCRGLEGISFSNMSQRIDLNSSIGIFSSLTDLTIVCCQTLSSLEQFLQNVPAIKRISILGCARLVSLPTEKFGGLHFLEELEVVGCPNFCSRSVLSPSLKRLSVREKSDGLPLMYQPPSNLLDNIDCCSLTYLSLSCSLLTSIQLHLWTLPALQELNIVACGSLTFIRNSESVFTNLPHHGGDNSIRTLSCLTNLNIRHCNELSNLDDLLTQEYLPAIEEIDISFCEKLRSLPGERFGSFPCLKELEIRDCPLLNWQRGLVLPPSLQRLTLCQCGDISAWFPSCLDNVTSLVSLHMASCGCIESIPGHLWSTNLASLERLFIRDFPDLVSIGGAMAIAKIKEVWIEVCPKLKHPKQPIVWRRRK